jgi:hypothetical protein
MTTASTIGRIVLITLAGLGGLMLSSALGMLFMHSSMMGGASLHGFMSTMFQTCSGMMGR